MNRSALRKQEINTDLPELGTNELRNKRSISYLALFGLCIGVASWLYLLHLAPNHYSAPTTKTIGLWENIVFGMLSAIFGPVLMAIEGLRIAPLMLLLNSALTLVLLISGKYKSGFLMWLLSGALSYFTMVICMTDGSVRELGNVGALVVMVVAPAVFPILVVLICIGLMIAGINASLRLLESFVSELKRMR